MVKRAALFILVAGLAAGCFGGLTGVPTLAPGQTLQPGQTVPPGQGGPTTSACNLVTAEEMSAIWGGGTMTPVPGQNNECTWGTINIRFESTDLATAKAILGNDADVTVSGRPGVIGSLFGVILYVQIGTMDMVVQTVLTEDNDTTRRAVIATAEKALSRLR